jgi:hypothetical protein
VERVEQEVARETAASSSRAQLETEIRAQEAKVARVADGIIEVGVSEHLKERLHQEEERLRDLRQKLAKAPSPSRRSGSVAGRVLAEMRARLEAAQREAQRPAWRSRPSWSRSSWSRPPWATGRDPAQDHDGRPGGRPVCDPASCEGRIREVQHS